MKIIKYMVGIVAGLGLAALVFIFLARSHNGQPLVGSNLPTLPVSITWTKGIIGNGYVLQIQNKIADALPVVVDCNSPTFGEKGFGVTLCGNAETRFGKLEGWNFAAGETITISSSGYSPIVRKAND
jgi:hypothetical protein